MKKLSILWFSALSFVHAIPFEELYGTDAVLENEGVQKAAEKQEDKIHLSFARAKLLHDFLLPKMRFLGNFVPEKGGAKEGIAIHQAFPQKDKEKLEEREMYSYPQDHVSSLIQHLFPSVDGSTLQFNTRNKDAFGILAGGLTQQELNEQLKQPQELKQEEKKEEKKEEIKDKKNKAEISQDDIKKLKDKNNQILSEKGITEDEDIKFLIQQMKNSNGKVELNQAIENLKKQKEKAQRAAQAKNNAKPQSLPKQEKQTRQKDRIEKKAIGRQVMAMMIHKIKKGAKTIEQTDMEKFKFDGFGTTEHKKILAIVNAAIEYADKNPKTIYGPNTRQFVVDLLMAYGLCLCESKKDLEDFKEILKKDAKFDESVFSAQAYRGIDDNAKKAPENLEKAMLYYEGLQLWEKRIPKPADYKTVPYTTVSSQTVSYANCADTVMLNFIRTVFEKDSKIIIPSEISPENSRIQKFLRQKARHCDISFGTSLQDHIDWNDVICDLNNKKSVIEGATDLESEGTVIYNNIHHPTEDYELDTYVTSFVEGLGRILHDSELMAPWKKLDNTAYTKEELKNADLDTIKKEAFDRLENWCKKLREKGIDIKFDREKSIMTALNGARFVFDASDGVSFSFYLNPGHGEFIASNQISWDRRVNLSRLETVLKHDYVIREIFHQKNPEKLWGLDLEAKYRNAETQHIESYVKNVVAKINETKDDEHNNIIRNTIIRNSPYYDRDFICDMSNIEFNPQFYGLQQADKFIKLAKEWFGGVDAQNYTFENLKNLYHEFVENKLIDMGRMVDSDTLQNMIDAYDLSGDSSRDIGKWLLKASCDYGWPQNIVRKIMSKINTKAEFEKRITDFDLTHQKNDILHILINCMDTFDDLKKIKEFSGDNFKCDRSELTTMINAFEVAPHEAQAVEKWLIKLCDNDLSYLAFFFLKFIPKIKTKAEFEEKIKDFDPSNNSNNLKSEILKSFADQVDTFENLKKLKEFSGDDAIEVNPFRLERLEEICAAENSSSEKAGVEEWLKTKVQEKWPS